MDKDISGASLRETGSREPSPSSTGLGPSGFDPARMSLVERMAWAMFDCYRGYNAETKNHMWLMARHGLMRQAEQALAAMREPTEAMIEASNREWDGRMSHRSSGAWQAMIDAALSERTGA